MTLPPLPRVLKQKEADFGIVFRQWLRDNRLVTGAYELKQTRTALPFTALRDDQIAYLLRIKRRGELIRVQGVKGEPDYIYLYKASAWVVVKYPKSFHIIDIDRFLLEKKISQRRSLTAERARDIATYDN